MRPRVLIACEFSGTVRDAFARHGCEAWSCDLLPSEAPGSHIQGDILTFKTGGLGILEWNWDLIIAHPPCTYLCNSGVRWLAPGGVLNPARHTQMVRAADFFAACFNAPCPRVAVENPVMHKYARDYLQSTYRELRHTPWPSCSFQPWQHGHGEVKRTCLWLRGLPPLLTSNVVSGREAKVHRASPGPDRWRMRSRTLPGVAEAMAAQWVPLLRP